MPETRELLRWAKNSECDVVSMFYQKLCETNSYTPEVCHEELYSEIRKNGGNSFVNLYRGEGVDYKALAYDVAESLRGYFKDRPYSETDLEKIESFILEKMEVTQEVIDELCNAISAEGFKDGAEEQVAKAAVKSATYAAGMKAAQAAAEKAAENALKEALKKKAGEKVAKKAAKEAATRAAKAAATRAAKKAAEKAAQKVAQQVLARIMAALNVILVAWTIIDLAGPAMRKTIPSATYIALLRQLHKNEVHLNG